jgi:hypothetical protein
MLSKFFSLKTLSIFIAVVSMFLVVTARGAKSSEDSIDMSQLSCMEFLEMDTMQQVMSLVWYNGFAAEKRGTFVFAPDRDSLSEQKDSLTNACETSSDSLVIEQLPAIFSN